MSFYFKVTVLSVFRILLILFLDPIVCSFEAQSGDDNVTLLYNGTHGTCVLQKSAILNGWDVKGTFALKRNYENGTTTGDYLPVDNQINYTPDIESGSSECNFVGNCVANWTEDGLTVNHSSTLISTAVVDERWNSFATYVRKTKPPTYDARRSINSTNFAISFSVKAAKQAHVFLCDGYGIRPSESLCYWIIFEGFGGKEYAFRRCNRTAPDNYPISGTDCVLKWEKYNVTEKFLSAEHWTHYTISREGTIITLRESTTEKRILSINETETGTPIDIKYLYFRNYEEELVEFKFHEYMYLRFEKPNVTYKLGPRRTVSKPLCVSFYVLMCPTCQINFFINTGKVEKGYNGSISDLPQWQNVVIENPHNGSYDLTMMGLSDQDGYWAISHVRNCHKNDTLFISKEVQEKSVSCLSTNREAVIWNRANEDTNVLGEYCYNRFAKCQLKPAILCDSYCETEYMCQGAGSQTRCNCGPFKTGENCDNLRFPVLEVLPRVYSHTGAQAVVEMENTTYKGHLPPKKYQIEYKEVGERHWTNHTLETWKGRKQTLIGPLKITGHYSFRAILYTDDKIPTYKRMYEKVPIVNFTVCKVEREFNLTDITKESMRYWFSESPNECEPKEYFIRLFKDQTFISEGYSNNYIGGLTTYTTYDFVVYYRDFEVNRTSFQTAESAPSEVRNPIVINSTSKSIALRWDPPDEPNGIIRGYNVSYRPVACAACQTANEWTANTSIVLNNLHPYSEYQITIAGYTVERGKEKETMGTTLSDAPNEVRYVTVFNRTSTSIALTWIEPDKPNGNITAYYLSYRRINCLACTTPGIRGFWKNVTTEATSIVLGNLHPYSDYQIKIAGFTVEIGKEVETNVTTLQNETNIDPAELPNSFTVNTYNIATKAYLCINWTSPECCSIQGKLQYNFSATCSGNEWCTRNVFQVVDLNATSVYLEVTPFSNYSVKLTAVRNNILKESEVMVVIESSNAAPNEVGTLNMSSTSTSIALSWDKPDPPNGIIRGYNISYRRIKCSACTTPRDRELWTNLATETTSVVLANLHPYSDYQVTIAGYTVEKGKELETNVSTLPDDMNIDSAELPKSFTVNTHYNGTKAYLRINWEPPECCSIRGNIKYNFSATCSGNEWCTHNAFQVVNINANLVDLEVTPFSNYSVKLTAVRNNIVNESEVKVAIKSNSAGPPAVRNLTAYSRENNAISIRWRKPYPPNGILDKYGIYEYLNNRWNTAEYAIPKECEFWDDFVCTDITKLKPGENYRIDVRAINKDNLWGNTSRINAITEQGKPAKPEALSSEWIDNHLVLHWNHPLITNGRIKQFNITLVQVKTDILQRPTGQHFQYALDIENPNKSYTFTLKKSYPYSSSYNLSVNAINNYKGEVAHIIINTPPEKPSLEEQDLVPKVITSETITLVIPNISEDTRSNTSFFYILVVNKNETYQEHGNIPSDIQKIVSKPHNFWIAAILECGDKPIEYTLGDNTRTSLKNESYHNKPLMPFTEYEVAVVPVNIYMEARSSEIYWMSELRTLMTPKKEAESYGMFALFLICLIPLAVWVIYKFVWVKKMGSCSAQTIEGMNRVASVNAREPDIIPLTQNTEVTNTTRPTIRPKPSKPKSKKMPEPEVTEAECHSFHSQLIPFVKFEEYVKQSLESTDLADQHKLFPRGQTKPWNYGMSKANKSKNRYNNLCAYDHNRVKLQKVEGDDNSDYINASYINGYKQSKAYIATQGPKPTTLSDFWKMIWQERVQYIVMVANVIEGGKRKCEQYWPELDTCVSYGEVKITHVHSDIYADYVFRVFNVSVGDENRTVDHLHYTSWPDHGVPLYPQSLATFIKKILIIPQDVVPIVVHCSAGVGRTGTIILCDISLRMAAREGAIDVLRYLHELREQRANMVDNGDQYKLVHMVILECLFTPNINITCNSNFATAVQNIIQEGGIQLQMNNLLSTVWQDKALLSKTTVQTLPGNEKKNRNEIVPVEKRIFLTQYPTTDQNSDYINAVPVDGFHFKDQFIVTQNPLPNTLGDFWRMVKEQKIKVILSLNEFAEDDETCRPFWPGDEEELSATDILTVTHTKSETDDRFDTHFVLLNEETEESEPEQTTVIIIQFKNWKHTEAIPDSKENLLHLWNEAENKCRNSYPMLITCYDGATACGVFVALSFVIEKMKLEQICDVCLATRVVRRNRKQFITNQKQFEFLYQAAVAYLNMFETYSNFKN